MSGLDLDAIDDRAKASKGAPWESQFDPHGESEDGNDQVIWALDEFGSPEGDPVALACGADAEFIAHAREDVPALVATIRAVLALHTPVPAPPAFYKDDRDWCSQDHHYWPCPTVRALS